MVLSKGAKKFFLKGLKVLSKESKCFLLKGLKSSS